MKYIFSSAFADRIKSFIEQKNALGFSYGGSVLLLYNFDRFCSENFPHETVLTKEICTAWAIRKETESNNTFLNRLMPIREFSKYLNRIGENAYILPTNLAKKNTPRIPHIYTEAEIAALWKILDNLTPCKRFSVRHLVAPVFIRLLYCCGLRPSEARKLNVLDVHLKQGRLNIAESKGHKNRIVTMADDVTEMCRRYDKTISRIMPNRTAFLPNPKGNDYNQDWFKNIFNDAKKKAGIITTYSHPPRLYDFRHTFATHRLYQWMHEGKDMSAMLPYLSAYMGHAQLSCTYYYIHLVPGLFEQMAGFDYSSLENILPEVESDE